MNRIAVFAHYDKNNTIEDYVVYFLKELNKVVNTLIFISDSDIDEKQISKIKPYISSSVIGRHGEYDFGSYKRGFLYAKKNNLLQQCEELVFVNDSCYAPLFPFEDMFNKMSNKNLDFWGNTSDRYTHFSPEQHIQSYFFVLKPTVFNSEEFNEFMCSIKKEDNKKNIVKKYEYGLTRTLENAGFNWDVYCQYSKKHWESTILNYKSLIKNNHNVFLKRSVPLLRVYVPVNYKWLERFMKKNTTYDFSLIHKDIERNKTKLDYDYIITFIYKNIGRFLILLIQKIYKGGLNG